MTVTLANAQATTGDLIRYLPNSVVSNATAPLVSTNIAQLVKQSKTVLLSINTVFPFDLFPDTLTIDQTKVNIIRRTFFGFYSVHSMLISDITDVYIDINLLFASLTIIDSSNYRFPIEVTVNNLRVPEAIRARQIIQGLIAAKRQQIDFSRLQVGEAEEQIMLVGKVRGEE